MVRSMEFTTEYDKELEVCGYDTGNVALRSHPLRAPFSRLKVVESASGGKKLVYFKTESGVVDAFYVDAATAADIRAFIE